MPPRPRNAQTFVKQIPTALADLEVELQTIVASHGFCPSIHGVCVDSPHSEVRMERLNCPNLAEKYETDADTPETIPEAVWDKIRRMVRIVYELEGIECIDITPYNFMQEGEGRVWMVDFGHAAYTTSKKGKPPANWFLRDFLEGNNCWNPDFR